MEARREMVILGAQAVTPVIPAVNAANVAVADLDNNSVILRLHMTINHLSRWLTAVHDQKRLAMSVYRGDPSVQEFLEAMRDEELYRYPMMHAMAFQNNPDLDRLPDPFLSRSAEMNGHGQTVLSVLSEFRRLRQNSCALLRTLPDKAWQRVGSSREEHDWQIRTLAEYLCDHDSRYMYAIDDMLDRNGVRSDINEASCVHYQELLQLVPVRR